MQQSDELGVDSDLEGEEPEVEEEDGYRTPTKKRRIRGELSREEKKQASSSGKNFQVSWLSLPRYKGWLRVDPKGDPKRGYCAPCDTRIKGGTSELDRHMRTASHAKTVKKMQVPVVQQRITEAFTGTPTQRRHKQNVKEAEIRIAALFADNNFAVSAVGDVVGVMKKIAKDSAIIKDVTLERTKCTALIKNVVAATELEETVAYLKDHLYTLLVDESTDIAMCKNMCILVKYMGSTRKIRLDLLELLELDAKDCSAANVFQLFEACMQKLGVPITNCIALACDNANVMVGAHNSFYSRLKAICPWLILLNCVCHSSAIVSSHACAKLPPVVKKLMQTTSTFISSSPKRTAELEEFAEFYEEQHNTVKKLSFTRWLVLHPCIVRFLELHRPLVQFFVMADFEDKKKETHANWILSELNNPFTMSYLKFLKYSLEFFNKFNALFQTKDTLIHKLSKSCEVILKQVCQNYVKNEFLPQIATLNLTSPHIQVPLESVYLGPECEAALAEIPLPNDPEKKMTREQLTRKREHDISQFRLRCLDFYVTAAKEIQHTFPIGKPIIKEMEFIDPKIALDENARGLSHLRDLHVLSNHFKDKLQLDPTTVAFEWRTLPGLFDQEQKEALLQMTPEAFWAEIHNSRDFEDNVQCPQLVKLAEAVLIMPHANADAERLFSIVTDTKTKKRNRMKNALLNAICITRTAFRTKNIDSVSLEITEKHLEKHNAAMYDT